MKYRLLKNLPGIKAGVLINENKIEVFMIAIVQNLNSGKIHIHPLQYPEWFEKIDEWWKPKDGEKYWFVHSDGKVLSSETYYDDNYPNYFSTKKQAEEAAKRIKQNLLDYHKELLF